VKRSLKNDDLIICQLAYENKKIKRGERSFFKKLTGVLLHGEEQAVYGDTPVKKGKKSTKRGESGGMSIARLVDIVNSLQKTRSTITSRVRYVPKGSMLS
jgi:hypothetical protein